MSPLKVLGGVESVINWSVDSGLFVCDIAVCRRWPARFSCFCAGCGFFFPRSSVALAIARSRSCLKTNYSNEAPSLFPSPRAKLKYISSHSPSIAKRKGIWQTKGACHIEDSAARCQIVNSTWEVLPGSTKLDDSSRPPPADFDREITPVNPLTTSIT